MRRERPDAASPKGSPDPQAGGLACRMEPSLAEHLAPLVRLWAEATTDRASPRVADLERDKRHAVEGFFRFAGKRPGEVTPVDVAAWRSALEARDLAPATVYYRVARLSSFFSWAMRHGDGGDGLRENPVLLAKTRPPRKYTSDSTKALETSQLLALVDAVRERARKDPVAGGRDLAILMFFVYTGLRRNEVVGLRGKDVAVHEDRLVVAARRKGGHVHSLRVDALAVRDALMAYLAASGRLGALGTTAPLWVRHDRGVASARTPSAVTSHAIARALARDAKSAGVRDFHLHRLRHTFARIVADASGSLHVVQEALGHTDIATTRIYVQRIGERADTVSAAVDGALALATRAQSSARRIAEEPPTQGYQEDVGAEERSKGTADWSGSVENRDRSPWTKRLGTLWGESLRRYRLLDGLCAAIERLPPNGLADLEAWEAEDPETRSDAIATFDWSGWQHYPLLAVWQRDPLPE